MTAQPAEQTSHEIMIPDASQEQQIILMDRMDLDQAMAELRGEVVQKFVYMAQGKRQLSYAGIKEAARMYRNVHFGATATPVAEGGWMITSYAHNMADNVRCDYPMPYPAFNPAAANEAIAFRASLSKSIRNALAAVLPISYLEAMILRWMDVQGGQQQVRGAQQARNITPTPAKPAIAAVAAPAVDPELAQLHAERARLVTKYPDAAAALKYTDDKLPEIVAKLQRRERLEDPASWVTEANGLLERYGAEVSPSQPAEIERCRAVIEAGRRLLPEVVPVAAKDMAVTTLVEYLENLYDAAQTTYPALFEDLPL